MKSTILRVMDLASGNRANISKLGAFALIAGFSLSSVSSAPAPIPAEVASLFPVGRTFEGVKIPSYSDNNLQTVLEADQVTRINAKFLHLTNLVVKVYNNEGDVESVIKMEKAQYDLVTRQLSSLTPARVEHEKFVMTGDQMGFDTIKNLSTMKGRVRVVIPKASQFMGNLGRKPSSGK